MGGAVAALINQIVIMFILMAIGYALYRMKIIDRKGTSQMANVVIYVAYPCITLRTLMVDFDPNMIRDARFCFVFTVVVTLISIPLTRLFFKKEDGVARYGAIFSNSGFIGVPIVMGVFGSEYVFYLSIGVSCLTFFIWTYGVWLVSGDKSQMSLKNCITNPNLIMILVGLVCFFFSIHSPALMATILDDLGALNTGLVMLVLGAYLAQSDMRAVVTSKKAYLVSLVRLVIIPAIVVGILALFPWIDAKIRLTMLIALGAPVASFAAILSEKYGGNYKFGIGLVTLSTILSLITMPIMLELASLVIV